MHVSLYSTLCVIVMPTEKVTVTDATVGDLFDAGCAHFECEDYEEAMASLVRGLELTRKNNEATIADFQRWIQKCTAKLETETDRKQMEPRYEWYQTAEYVSLAFYIKDRSENDLEIEISERELTIRIKLADSNVYEANFSPLYHRIKPEGTQHTIGKYKIEVRLNKLETIAWKGVKGTPVAVPPCGKNRKNWDTICEEEEEDKPEGDAALNQLFRNIYGNATDETRMAMNKSFVESGGTVLSTNWDEVGTKLVEATPPDGMEFKKYGQ